MLLIKERSSSGPARVFLPRCLSIGGFTLLIVVFIITVNNNSNDNKGGGGANLCWANLLITNPPVTPHQKLNMITIIYEEFDPLVAKYVGHLNATRYYYGAEKTKLNTLKIPGNVTEPNELKQLVRETDVLLSLALTESGIEMVKELAYVSSVPTIQLWLNPWDFRNRRDVDNDNDHAIDNYVLLIPGFTVFDNILPELVQRLNITTEILVLYDPFYDERTVKLPFKELGLPHNAISMFEQDDAIKLQIQQLQFSAKNIFVVARTFLVEKYLASELRFQFEAQHFNKFVVFSKDTLALRCENCLSANLYWIRMVPNGTIETLRKFNEFIKDKELSVELGYSAKSFDELQVTFCLDVFSLVYEYLYSVEENNATALKPLLESNSSGDEEDEDGDERYQYGPYKRLSTNVFYQNVTGGIFKIERREDQPENEYYKYIANWTLEGGIRPFYTSLGVNVSRIRHIRIVTILQEPFLQMNGTDMTGYCKQLLDGIMEDLSGLRLSYELLFVPDGKFGTMDSNGNWNGMIGMLVNGLADFALGPISVTAEREIDVDFTVPFYDLVGTSILMRRTDNEYSLFKFVKVLEWPVWVCIVTAYIFTSFLLWLFDKFSPYSYTNNRDRYTNQELGRVFTLRECFWFCITSLTPQGGGEAPQNVSGRLVAATWWLFGFIILASYTANLAAFLTVSRREQTITSLDDLTKQYKIAYSTIKGGSAETYFQRMAEIEEEFYRIWKQMSLNESIDSRDRAKLAVWDYPISDKFTNMWRFMQESKFPRSLEKGIERVLNSPRDPFDRPYALVGDAMAIKYATLVNCRLQKVGPEFSRKPYAIATQTGHPLKDKLSASILKMLNKRELERLKELWWNQNPHRKECQNPEEESSGISIQNIGGVFIVIICGVGVSLVILFFEYIYFTQRAPVDEADGSDNRERQTEGLTEFGGHQPKRKSTLRRTPPLHSPIRTQSPGALSLNAGIVGHQRKISGSSRIVRRETGGSAIVAGGNRHQQGNSYYVNSAYSQYEDHD